MNDWTKAADELQLSAFYFTDLLEFVQSPSANIVL